MIINPSQKINRVSMRSQAAHTASAALLFLVLFSTSYYLCAFVVLAFKIEYFTKEEEG